MSPQVQFKSTGEPVVIIGRLGDFNYEEWAPLKCKQQDSEGGRQWGTSVIR